MEHNKAIIISKSATNPTKVGIQSEVPIHINFDWAKGKGIPNRSRSWKLVMYWNTKRTGFLLMFDKDGNEVS